MDVDEPLVLLNPGPACTSERVRSALGRGDMCHREPEFSALLESIRSGLVRSLGLADSHEAIVVTGSGTSALEMAVISSVRASHKMLVVVNGVYGERIARIARVNGIEVIETRFPITVPADPAEIVDVLDRHADVDVVACVEHETSTGLLNPVAELGRALASRPVTFVIDAISSMACEEQDLAAVGADFIAGTANKGLHGLPGMSFVLASHAGIERLQAVPERSLYLNAATYLAGQRKGDVPFTPAVQVCYALDEAIKEFEEHGGHKRRAEDYRERAELVRRGYQDLGLEILIEEPYRANCVTALRLPDGMDYPTLHDRLRRRGFVIYAGQGNLSSEIFRVATMGHLSLPTLSRFLDALGDSLREG
jgi:2-aminoethylphosphonate-pyruvate transaminase